MRQLEFSDVVLVLYKLGKFKNVHGFNYDFNSFHLTSNFGLPAHMLRPFFLDVSRHCKLTSPNRLHCLMVAFSQGSLDERGCR